MEIRKAGTGDIGLLENQLAQVHHGADVSQPLIRDVAADERKLRERVRVRCQAGQRAIVDALGREPHREGKERRIGVRIHVHHEAELVHDVLQIFVQGRDPAALPHPIALRLDQARQKSIDKGVKHRIRRSIPEPHVRLGALLDPPF